MWIHGMICKVNIQDCLLSLSNRIFYLEVRSLKQFCHLTKISRAGTVSFRRSNSVPRTSLEFIQHWEKVNEKSISLLIALRSAELFVAVLQGLAKRRLINGVE